MTVMGDALMDGLSDAGSTPARSTKMNKSKNDGIVYVGMQYRYFFGNEGMLICIA